MCLLSIIHAQQVEYHDNDSGPIAFGLAELTAALEEQGRQVENAKVGLVDTLGGDGVIVNLVLTTD